MTKGLVYVIHWTVPADDPEDVTEVLEKMREKGSALIADVRVIELREWN